MGCLVACTALRRGDVVYLELTLCIPPLALLALSYKLSGGVEAVFKLICLSSLPTHAILKVSGYRVFTPDTSYLPP